MLLFLPLVLAGCAGAAPPEAAPAPEEVEALEPAPPPEPEPSLRERWGAPFAVQSEGRPEPREPRAAVVQLGADTMLAVAAPAASAAPEPDVDAQTAPEREAADATDTPPAPAPAEPAVAPPPPARGAAAARTHTVAASETFYGIALRYGLSFSDLVAANPGVAPDRIRIGQELRVRPVGGRAAARAPRRHEVVRGDTLFGIARRYEVSAQAIREANRLDTDNVRIGQILVIPGSG